MSYNSFIKPLFDKFVALLMLIILSPVLLLGVCLAVIASGASPIFAHQRPGLNGAPFKVLKLRTMRPQYADGRRLSNIERISPLGHFLRKSSIDELPQLINVLRGQLSLVGPRPLEMRYLSAYTPRQMKRHNVLPGITGLAQVSGRNQLSWEEKFELDVFYVEHLSWKLDMEILFKTAVALFRANDVNADAKNTMKPFVESDEV